MTVEQEATSAQSEPGTSEPGTSEAGARRWLIFALPVLLFAGLVAFFGLGLTKDPSRIESVLIDRPLPPLDLEALPGYEKGLTTEDIKGKVALVNVFASWCVPCRIEHPVLNGLAERGEAVIYGVNWKDRPGAGAEWLAELGDPYTLVGADRDGRAAIDLGVTGAPETFIVDAEGVIRYKQIGPITPGIWERDIKPIVMELQGQ